MQEVSQDRSLVLSIVMPARNEACSVAEGVSQVAKALRAAHIAFELIVVNDHSADATAHVLQDLRPDYPELRPVDNDLPPGFGYAIRCGLNAFRGDAACIVMADSSDDAADIVTYYRKLEEGYDCVFGSRFLKGSRVVDYPPHKLLINRLANLFIACLFGLRYNDVTNAFKCYRRRVIEGMAPLFSCHFNLTVEMPLKAIVRGYSYAVVPINWYNRKEGVSKLKIKEMGSRYLFIVLYVWLEKHLARGDYRKKSSDNAVEPVSGAGGAESGCP